MPLSNYVVQIVAYNEAGSSVAALQQDFTRVDQAPTVESELMPPLEVSHILHERRYPLLFCGFCQICRINMSF